jgi:hypothetical protein
MIRGSVHTPESPEAESSEKMKFPGRAESQSPGKVDYSGEAGNEDSDISRIAHILPSQWGIDRRNSDTSEFPGKVDYPAKVGKEGSGISRIAHILP